MSTFRTMFATGLFTTTLVALSFGQRSSVPQLLSPHLAPDWAKPPVMNNHMMELAGEGALNCGRVRYDQDASLASDCALNAFKAKKRFYVRYDLPGIDSDVSVGVVGKGTNEVYTLVYDSTLSSNDKGDLSKETRLCPIPVNLVETKSGRLKCLSPDPDAENVLPRTDDIY